MDLVLGGHDHSYDVHVDNNRLLLKSGTDFKDFSRIEITFFIGGIPQDV